MLFIPQKKNQYALRAIFELAKRAGKGPTKISEIAEAQAIPPRFLEVILSQLKGSGIVDAKRGFYGGYFLIRSPGEITVGHIMRYMDEPLDAAHCSACVSKSNCPHKSNCAFSGMWNRVRGAAYEIFDTTTIQYLIDKEKAGLKKRPGV